MGPSLIDTLLLEPFPLEVFIAYRMDSIKGDGTMNSPFDGSSAAKFDALMAWPTTPPVISKTGPRVENRFAGQTANL